MKKTLCLIFLFSTVFCFAQNTVDFDSFRNSILSDYSNERKSMFARYDNFRDSVNIQYAQFLREIWVEHSSKNPVAVPVEHNPVPPKPYSDPIKDNPISIVPDRVPIIDSFPKPNPIEPIKENIGPRTGKFDFNFFGLKESIRIPKFANIHLNVSKVDNIADAWHALCEDEIDSAIIDVLSLRDKYNLCDWAYLSLLDAISSQFCDSKNGSTLLMAFLFCQSGYQMRLAIDSSQLIMLFGSRHQIFDMGYYIIDNLTFYPYGGSTGSLRICPATFEGEQPLSLIINREQLLGGDLSRQRIIKSNQLTGISSNAQVPNELIKFYDTYPTSAFGGNILSRWAMYANTPLAESTKKILYPKLTESIAGCSKLEAANKLLNWVQTGFEYEFDDKIWGHDRAFFAEETLYYPYADCEDRSILFSRLIRDLLGLDVALIYYPGHLATAVKFNSEVQGDAMIIDGKRYVVCDPTYIGAPVGAQMPNLEYDKAQAIVL